MPTDSISIDRVLNQAVQLSGEEYDAKITMLKWCAEKSRKRGYPLLEMNAQVELGWVYSESHDQENAVRSFNNGRLLAEKLNRREDELGCVSTIAAVYFYANQKKKACQMYELTLRLCKKYNLTNGLDNAYANLGVAYYELSLKDPVLRKKAIAYMKKGQELSLAQNDTTAIVSNYQTLSRIYLDKNQIDSALHYADLAFTTASSHGMVLPRASMYLTRAVIFERTKKYTVAIHNYSQGAYWANKFHQAIWLGENYKGLAECYARLGDYKNAYDYFHAYTVLNDSIKNTENFAKAADIQNKYERQKNDRIILQSNKINEVKKLEQEKEDQLQKNMYFFIAGATLMGISLIVLVFFQVKNLREKRTSYNLLQQKNIDIQHQSGRLAYQARLIAKYQSQMNPHFIFNAINNIQGLVLTGNTDKTVLQLQNFKQLMQQTLDNAEQDYITLEKEAAYLKNYVGFEQARFTTPFAFTIRLPQNAETILVPPMIIQPFIENAIKHAALHTVENSYIQVTITANTLLHIRIADNGKGFDMKKSNVLKKGHALDIIQSRIRLFFEAENIALHPNFFSVNSIEGSGTEIEIILPLRYV